MDFDIESKRQYIINELEDIRYDIARISSMTTYHLMYSKGYLKKFMCGQVVTARNIHPITPVATSPHQYLYIYKDKSIFTGNSILNIAFITSIDQTPEMAHHLLTDSFCWSCYGLLRNKKELMKLYRIIC